MKRRDFIKTSAIGAGATLSGSFSGISQSRQFSGKPLVISSNNGLPSCTKAMEMIKSGSDALDAVIAGVNIVENNPDDTSVGYGGLPNEDGIVELDSCCMHGPTHNAGAVAALQGIKNPSKVARLVMERTDHVLLVGRGALKFAKMHGFEEESLLTEKARKAWLKWKEIRDPKDNWFPPDQDDPEKAFINDIPFTYGTITCLGIDLKGNISGVTTTSGLSYKIAGRVGDSPIIGAGLYVDNEVGACGSTGRGEENLKNLTCFLIVEYMRDGLSPLEACKKGILRVIDKAKKAKNLFKDNKPTFNVSFYALNKSGEYSAARIFGPAQYTVNNGTESIHKDVENYLYEW